MSRADEPIVEGVTLGRLLTQKCEKQNLVAVQRLIDTTDMFCD